ncbi:MAG: YbjQ family protein [Alphaproteobacteria bacterium]|nr:YbjQ family protein [Alphaproteobacteria bacterium]
MADIVVLVVMLLLGLAFGTLAEKRHYKSIIRRERETKDIALLTLKTMHDMPRSPSVCYVAGSVVISVDFFKKFLAMLKNFFGGRLTSYESLLDRARREAILRMKIDAAKMGANFVYNVRLETSSISKGRKGKVGAIEVLAYGTAVIEG